MSASAAKQSILDKIRAALAKPTPLPFPEVADDTPVFQPLQEDIVVAFAEQFTSLGGKFSFCLHEADFVLQMQQLCAANKWADVYCSEPALTALLPRMQWHDAIATCDASLTSCEALVARTGSMLLSSTTNGRIPSVYAPIHICVAYASQLVYDIGDALKKAEAKYGGALPSLLSFATGPSRTADIEKTLVVGVHGPKEVYCFLIDDTEQK